MTKLTQRLEVYRDRVDRVLATKLPSASNARTSLQAAMRYSATNGGKRIRPVLTYATGQALGVPIERLDTPAAAVELMHAYSLVHDDLPAMDNDDLRRGIPTCHRKFDEATAILAGDALQALAFTLLAANTDTEISDANKLQMIRALGDASGANGMAAGQAIDLESVGRQLNLNELQEMHRHKTGELIRASVRVATLSVSPTEHRNYGEGTGQRLDQAVVDERLDRYASAVGLTFQIVDDILDVVADTETLGKTQGADAALNKPTYPALLGLDGARKHARETHESALDALSELGQPFEELREISAFIVDRSF